METVSFTKMEDGTAEEYDFLTPLYNDCLSGVADTLLKILKQMQEKNWDTRLTDILILFNLPQEQKEMAQMKKQLFVLYCMTSEMSCSPESQPGCCLHFTSIHQ